MTGALYAVLFSNGTVKVGRGTDPEKRIREHSDRLSVVGISVSRAHHREAVDDVGRAESALIQRLVLTEAVA